jgi:hypothetical protein
MSLEDFRQYYESHHAQLGVKVLTRARRYVRRYISPFPDPISGAAESFEYDVITEVWFDTRRDFELMMNELALPETVAEIAADEDRLFDRSKNRLVLVDEVESNLGHSTESALGGR